jgi:hypothetical protein
MTENPLSILINRELSSVEFVGDYIQFRLEGSTLSVYSDPVLIIGGRIYKRESQEFCNLMVSCIGQVVEMAEVKEGDAIKIEFKNGSMLYISLKPEDYKDVEAVWFDDVNNSGNWWIW